MRAALMLLGALVASGILFVGLAYIMENIRLDDKRNKRNDDD